MASITLCPRCSSHLELPSGLAPTSLVECPICEAEFLLASVAPRAIPKVRLVEHDATTENKTTETPSAPLGIIVDDADVASAEPAPSVDDRLSRLMRSASSWQLPGVQQPEENEAAAADEDDQPSMLDSPTLDLEISDERIIPNDHAPAVKTFGATLDAAYRDADPETADKPSSAADELQLAGSRLDQLLSDLMKPQTVAAAASPAEPTVARTESPAPPTFTEFVEWKERYTQAIRAFASKHPDCVLIDLSAHFEAIPLARRLGLFTDHVHLSAEGNRVFAVAVHNSLRQRLWASDPPSRMP